MTVLLLSLIAPIAQAQDADGDGCVDSYYDATTACVAVSATIGSGTTLQSGADVGANAQVGADIDVGQGVFIGSRATLVGRVSATGARPVGEGTVIGRRAFIDADHDLGPDGTFGRAVTTGERLTTENLVSLGYGTTLGDDVFLGSGAILGSLVTVGNNTRVEPGAVLARGATVADSNAPLPTASIAGVIGPNVTIGYGADLRPTLRVRKDTILGNNVTAGAQVRIGRDVLIGDDVVLESNVRIGAGATVTATSLVPNGTVVARGETYDNPVLAGIAGGTDVVTLPGGVSMTFRGIPAGTFEMGCKPGRDDNASGVDTGVPSCSSSTSWTDGIGLHSVTLTRELYCGETEVTQDQFAAAPGSPRPAYFSPTGPGSRAANSPNPPVEWVSWHDAAWYANWLTTSYNTANGASLSQCYTCSGSYSAGDGNAPGCAPVANITACDGFRLPTEAEWEYAARGGESHPFAGSANAGSVAWYSANNGSWNTATGGTKSTATKASNAFGLYDMSGNVWEWTNDWSNGAAHSTASVTDPVGPASGSYRSIRGGIFIDAPRYVRSSYRNRYAPGYREFVFGFRLCRSVP